MRQNSEPIIVFSHLGWDFVYQRPQHLLSRLAARRPIYFIEEPILDENQPPHWQLSRPMDNVLICRAHTPVPEGGFNNKQLPYLATLLQELLRQEKLDSYIVWLYTPMALPLAKTIEPEAVVFDVMDELSAFKFAPQELLDLERETLDWADVVFTGGPSLYKAKLGRHGNVHLFSSSVDAAHFGQSHAVEEPADQRGLAHPRFGFYGVIDERMDIDLLDSLAKAHPEWQIVMVGPVVKIDAAALPKHPNLHFLGQRSYAELPAYLKGWDVALLPFALNDSTKFISPTKTLEYMAAEKPIVSTPITDVAEPYGHIVYLGRSHDDFISACEQALSAPPEEKERRAVMMREVLAQTSWDKTVSSMEALIDQAVLTRYAQRAEESVA